MSGYSMPCGDILPIGPHGKPIMCAKDPGHDGLHGVGDVGWTEQASGGPAFGRSDYDRGVLDTVKRFEVLAAQIAEFAPLFVPPADRAIRNAATTIRNVAKQIRSGEVES